MCENCWDLTDFIANWNSPFADRPFYRQLTNPLTATIPKLFLPGAARYAILSCRLYKVISRKNGLNFGTSFLGTNLEIVKLKISTNFNKKPSRPWAQHIIKYWQIEQNTSPNYFHPSLCCHKCKFEKQIKIWLMN